MSTLNTRYVKQGSMFIQTSAENLPIMDQLPPGNYSIGYSQQIGFYFESIDGFEAPDRVYGEHEQIVDRILYTFESRPNSTGVLLAGEKGSGKTLIAKLISLAAAKKGMPTIVINSVLKGEAFNRFIQQLTQPAVIIFDEMEKVYDKDDQKELLTLFDGVYPSSKLFIVTANDKWQLDTNLRNRPGRIYYAIDFAGLEPEFIEEYCRLNLENQEFTPQVVAVSKFFYAFNFDIMKSLVEEVNRFNQPPYEALRYLNAKPETDKDGTYKVEVTMPGKKVDGWYPEEIRGNPLAANNWNFQVYIQKETEQDDTESESVQINMTDFQGIDSLTGTFTFKKADGTVIGFKRQRERAFRMDRMDYGYSDDPIGDTGATTQKA